MHTVKVEKIPVPRLRFLELFWDHSAIFPRHSGNDIASNGPEKKERRLLYAQEIVIKSHGRESENHMVGIVPFLRSGKRNITPLKITRV